MVGLNPCSFLLCFFDFIMVQLCLTSITLRFFAVWCISTAHCGVRTCCGYDILNINSFHLVHNSDFLLSVGFLCTSVSFRDSEVRITLYYRLKLLLNVPTVFTITLGNFSIYLQSRFVILSVHYHSRSLPLVILGIIFNFILGNSNCDVKFLEKLPL